MAMIPEDYIGNCIEVLRGAKFETEDMTIGSFSVILFRLLVRRIPVILLLSIYMRLGLSLTD